MSDSEEYEDELVTSHSDENPELGGGGRKPLATYTTEGSAVSDLYKNRDPTAPFRYKPNPGETVVYEEIYIPDVEE